VGEVAAVAVVAAASWTREGGSKDGDACADADADDSSRYDAKPAKMSRAEAGASGTTDASNARKLCLPPGVRRSTTLSMEKKWNSCRASGPSHGVRRLGGKASARTRKSGRHTSNSNMKMVWHGMAWYSHWLSHWHENRWMPPPPPRVTDIFSRAPVLPTGCPQLVVPGCTA
jgi:hypothetical protein